MGKLKSYLLSYIIVVNRPSLSIARRKLRYEADQSVFVVSLFQAQWDKCDQHNYLVKGHHLHSGT